MIVGNVGAIAPNAISGRLMAFSGIAQAGYSWFWRLAGVGRNGLEFPLLFYLAAYAFGMVFGAFAVVALIGDGDEHHADLAAYRGLFFRWPVPAALMMLFFLSLAGIPGDRWLHRQGVIAGSRR